MANFYQYNGSIYRLSTAVTWQQAQAQAQSLGGNLVTVNNQAEQDWLVSTFGGSELLWIGFTDEVTEGQFRWVNGETSTYTNWNIGEPNNSYLGQLPENYVHMNWGSSGKWNDIISSLSYRGIIEIKNTINGGDGNDTLNSNGDVYTLIGGKGDDTYIVDSTTDAVIENANEGTDTIQSSVTLTLATNVENLTLTGTAAINGTGNAANNVITGNSANNILNGGAGNDTLSGGAGDDIVNYAGSHTEFQTNILSDGSIQIKDNVTSNGDEGTDTLIGVERINFAASGGYYGVVTGGSGNDFLTATNGWSLLFGGDGNDTLNGTDGNDTLNGGAGNDTLNGDAGYDIVNYAGSHTEFQTNILSDGSIQIKDNVTSNGDEGTDTLIRVERINFAASGGYYDVLTGGSGNDSLTATNVWSLIFGGAGNDTLGGSVGKDTLSGGAGTDTLNGGAGDDILNPGYSQGSTDTVNGGDGNDLLQVDYTSKTDGGGIHLGAYNTNHIWNRNGGQTLVNVFNVENYNITGTQYDDVFEGRSGNDTFNGGAGNDTLSGGGGNDTLNGGAGTDTLIGGLGDDIYIVDSTTDTITENANEGTDTIQSSVTLTLATNVENLTLTGTAVINGTGNELNNVITGNSANNTLNGGAGNDTLDGGAGTDTLIGGTGDDIYIIDSTTDTITENANEGTDTIQSSVTLTLATNVENLTLTGTAVINGTGNELNNVITGNSANNTLNGGAGNDTLNGGAGNDTLNGEDGNDLLYGDVASYGASTLFNYNGNTYLLSTAGTWQQAQAQARSLGGNLVTVNNQAEQDWLVSTFGGSELLWIGFTDEVTEGQFRWVNGETSTYTNWSPGEPNNAHGGEDYAMMNWNWAGIWNDDSGTVSLRGIIEIVSANDILNGGAGNDTLNGGAGTDTLIGGLGDDIYIIDSTTEIITENANEGIDTIQSSVTYTIAATNVENLTLTGTAAINGTGNELNNVITGNGANNSLDGGAGIDTLIGGLGDDIYVVDSTTDTITENANAGTDTIQSSVTLTLATNVENLTLTGTAVINGTGNELNNVITGNSANNTLDGGNGNDTLDGGAGNDTLIGGIGDDIYIVDSTTDIITELASGGTDTIQSSVTYSIAARTNIENLTLTGTAVINGTGNAGNNVVTGNSANNTLNGAAGNDTLDGGAGNDTLIGGTGNDIYIVDSTTDIITELASGGTDTIQSSVTFSIVTRTNIENLTLTGAAVINATGNAANNVIRGNSANNTLNGAAGNDTLDGGAGNDTLIGGTGNDIYIVDSTTDTITENANEGTDTIQSSVTLTLATNVENLTLTGTAAINGTGNELNNVITGNSAINTLNGGAGNDTLMGGLGDDIYIVDSTTDTITENVNEGTDTIQSSVTYTIAALANVENLTLTGTTAIDGTGNAANNVITGNTANNILDGGAGNDTLIGGTGDDIYIVDSTTEIITENANAGIDIIQSSVTLTLATNVENLNLTGTTAINGTGNGDNNVITGNAGNNTLDGSAGTDTLIGGLGDDIYYVDDSNDSITEDVDAGIDIVYTIIDYALSENIENLTLTGTVAIEAIGNELNNIITGNELSNVLDGSGGIDTLIGGLGDDNYVVDNTNNIITENANEGMDTVYTSINYALSGNIENLTLTGTATNGTGNELNNIITGNELNNVLDGSGGIDTLIGGVGDDNYVVDNTNDIITEYLEEGTDTIQSSVTYTLATNVENLNLTGTTAINGTGNGDNNVITGNAANNILDGGAGTDTLIGGLGDDIYIVDSTTDTITENVGEGTDTIQSGVTYTIAAANVENLTLTGTAVINGTGNAANNVITGNDVNNILDGGAGNDTLNGAAGTDTLIGGLGDDIYIVDSTTDTITENVGEGTDTIQSGVTYTITAANVENLTLTGTAVINGTGNAANNVITGNDVNNILDGGAGNDTLNGAAGTDTLIGGLSDDIYIVDSTTDTITENANEGTDTIQSSVTYIITAANVENLTLTGTAVINGTGNELNNIITGNAGNNVIIGNAGNDTFDGGAGTDVLIGGLGDDIYVVDSTTDTIVENVGEGIDTIQSGVTYTIAAANVENLTLTGTAVINGTGNELNNVITGNGANNILDGGSGNDTLIGGLGNDIYIVDSTTDTITENASGGTDTIQSSVTYTIAALANVENLTLAGTTAINGTGNAANNVITGNTGNNTLDGGAGTDTLIGGTGDDIYIVDSTTDTITENTSGGTDTIQSSVTYTIAAANVENLTLTGTAVINGTGNAANNVITGNTANNILDGGLGTDILIGGTGDDIYVVDSTTDTITENTSGGTDTIQSSVTYTIAAANVENLTLTGTTAINGTGNAANNVITGNAGNNILTGGLGKDTLTGGLGVDRFDYRTLAHSAFSIFDVITDFNATTGNDLFLVTTARSGFNNVTTPVATLDATGIAARLTTTVFTANSAAQFTFGSRSFVAINDATAGFSATTDAIIEVTGLTGTLGSSNFTIA
jgi:Ca2+-binding RTX toxin-like protein